MSGGRSRRNYEVRNRKDAGRKAQGYVQHNYDNMPKRARWDHEQERLDRIERMKEQRKRSD
jgi:hypothetical protein